MRRSNQSGSVDQVTAACEVARWEANGRRRSLGDLVTVEEPLEIRVRGEALVVTMRTPGHDAELAAGFLLSEGLIRERADVVEVAPCALRRHGDQIVNVFVARGAARNLEGARRPVFVSSSCGICGKGTVDAVHQHFPPIERPPVVKRRTILSLPARLRKTQEVFKRTGSLHAAAIFDDEGNLVVAREDVGRHNAVDKALGWGFLEARLPWDRHILMVSGRISFEIVQKALAARIPVVAAVSAPSSLAVEFARESGQVLIGFLRARAFNVYAGKECLREG